MKKKGIHFKQQEEWFTNLGIKLIIEKKSKKCVRLNRKEEQN